MRARMLTVLLVLAVAAAAVPAWAADQTSLTVTRVSTTSSTVKVQGVLRLGSSAFEPMTVSTDPVGDATVAGPGLDMGDTVATVSGYATSPKLTVRMTVNGQAPPLTGYAWPLHIDDFEGTSNYWLGAGTAGTGGVDSQPQTEPWVGRCYANANFSCDWKGYGSVDATGITWELPLGPTVKVGSRVTVPTGSYGKHVPHVFPWPGVWWWRHDPQGTYDTASPTPGFTVPGGIEVGISKSVAKEPASYLAAGHINTKTGVYTVPFDNPGPGQYVLWVRSCHGLANNLTCVRHTQNLTL